MNAKLLPLAEPPIRGFLHHAYPLSILANNESYLPWFHCEYLQLTCTSEYDENIPFQLDFFYEHEHLYSFPYLHVNCIHTNLLQSFATDIISFIISSINLDYYVYIHVDEFYIPMAPDYQKRHFTHNILVSGYNLATKELTITGFNHQLRYTSSSVSFEMFAFAFDNANYHLTYLLKYDEAHMLPTFRLDLIIRYLEDYLSARNSFIRSTNWHKYLKYDRFGMDIYPSLQLYLKRSCLIKAPPSFIPFHILWEHKKSVLGTIIYLNQLYTGFDEFIAGFNELVQVSKLIKHWVMKCNITFQAEMIHHCLLSINQMKDIEFKLLERLVRKLNKLNDDGGLNYKFKNIF